MNEIQYMIVIIYSSDYQFDSLYVYRRLSREIQTDRRHGPLPHSDTLGPAGPRERHAHINTRSYFSLSHINSKCPIRNTWDPSLNP